MARAREFDEQALLDAAVELFWVNGYRASSLIDLSEVTRVSNGSLYQAYGTKWSLFLAAFRRYCDGRASLVESLMAGPHTDAEQTVADYFDAIIDDCASRADRRGCLLLNTISELGDDPEVAAISTAAIARMEHALAGALAETVGDIDEADLPTVSAEVVALSQALIQLSRVGRDAAELRRIGRRAASQIGRSLQPA
ncbi:TetR/AcrR family transcriptional regulator [Microbacterium sp. P05]|uniref:TetR/AcrR family transcriptional regulator n=1 Tax=Microbacterium sp. P05 TaxID=3366948 RepID=UPI003744F18D